MVSNNQPNQRGAVRRGARKPGARKQLEQEEPAKAKKAEEQPAEQQPAGEAAKATRAPTSHVFSKQDHLPDGSKFAVVYDASKTQWTGTLTIGGSVFTGSASAVFTLLKHLDRQYRESLPSTQA